VTYPGVTFYSKSFIPEGLSTEELLYNYNYNITEGYHQVSDEKENDTLTSFKRITTIIKILERFQLLVSYLKTSIISSEDIYNILLMQQIKKYEENNNEVGSILEAEFKCSNYESYETLIEAKKLKYADTSEMLAYIRYQEYQVKKLLKDNNFKEVENIIVDMQQKLKI
jgi:hypothetical protein